MGISWRHEWVHALVNAVLRVLIPAPKPCGFGLPCSQDITIGAGFRCQLELKPHWGIAGNFVEIKFGQTAALLAWSLGKCLP
jgi:hypothetical protein